MALVTGVDSAHTGEHQQHATVTVPLQLLHLHILPQGKLPVLQPVLLEEGDHVLVWLSDSRGDESAGGSPGQRVLQTWTVLASGEENPFPAEHSHPPARLHR